MISARPDPSKTEKVRCFPVPHDVTNVCQFIGLASLYRRFVPDFAHMAAPLHALTWKNVVFEWSSACQDAFNQLKEVLITAPILAYSKFGPGVEFVLETDASGVGLGAVLSQSKQMGKFTRWHMPPDHWMLVRRTMGSQSWRLLDWYGLLVTFVHTYLGTTPHCTPTIPRAYLC